MIAFVRDEGLARREAIPALERAHLVEHDHFGPDGPRGEDVRDVPASVEPVAKLGEGAIIVDVDTNGVREHGTGDSTLRPMRTMRGRLLVDAEHYDQLIARDVASAKVSVWISTANLKTMLVEAPIGSRARARGRFISFFETLADLARRGVDVCILHASPPSGPLKREIDRLGASSAGLVKLRRCPRVHLKMIAIDGRLLYLGSANVTGAGLGAKGEGRRNFEMGIVTDDTAMLDAAQARFDRIWRGAECAACKLRGECPRPLSELGRARVLKRAPRRRAGTSLPVAGPSRGPRA